MFKQYSKVEISLQFSVKREIMKMSLGTPDFDDSFILEKCIYILSNFCALFRYGRKRALIIMFVGVFVSCILVSFMPNFPSYVTMRTICASFTIASYIACYTYGKVFLVAYLLQLKIFKSVFSQQWRYPIQIGEQRQQCTLLQLVQQLTQFIHGYAMP